MIPIRDGLIPTAKVTGAGLSTAATDAPNRQWTVAAVDNPCPRRGLCAVSAQRIATFLHRRQQFRAGLAEFIDNKQPVAVTRHGQTVGFFIHTGRSAQADLQALRDAADKLKAVMSLSEDDVEAAVRDFDALRKGAPARRRAQT